MHPSTENQKIDLFVIAGEPSGDLHGQHLMRALLKEAPSMNIAGIGGPHMRKEGLKCLLPMEEFQLMGISEVIKKIPKILKNLRFVRNKILACNPKAVIFIDYPDFNIRMAKALRKKGYKGKLIHYICPTVWAWRKGRMKTLCSTLDLLLCIFPFEKKYFENTSLKTIYVGNPSFEECKTTPGHAEWTGKHGINPERPLLGIFPGSRKSVVLLDLPKQLQAARRLQEDDPALAIGVSIASKTLFPAAEKIIAELGLGPALNKDLFLVPGKYTYDLMQMSKTAIATSGTVTLELALHEIPTVVVYDLTKFNGFLAKHVVRFNLPFYCIVNILCERSVFPELIYKDFTVENAYLAAKELHLPGTMRDQCLKECRRLPEIFSTQENPHIPPQSASQKAAHSILALI